MTLLGSREREDPSDSSPAKRARYSSQENDGASQLGGGSQHQLGGAAQHGASQLGGASQRTDYGSDAGQGDPAHGGGGTS